MNTEQLTKKHLLIFGATGKTGLSLVKQALRRGFNVSVYVRDASKGRKLFQGLLPMPRIVQGDAMDTEQIDAALSPAVDAVVSAMGIYQNRAGSDDPDQSHKKHTDGDAEERCSPIRVCVFAGCG